MLATILTLLVMKYVYKKRNTKNISTKNITEDKILYKRKTDIGCSAFDGNGT